MSYYLDSSVVVSAVTAEPATTAIQQWLQSTEEVLISAWSVTEAVAALSRKRRMQIISADQHVAAMAALRREFTDALRWLPVTRQEFGSAATFAERFETGLRAGDALHLAVAAAAGVTLATADRGQARAGSILNIPTLLLI